MSHYCKRTQSLNWILYKFKCLPSELLRFQCMTQNFSVTHIIYIETYSANYRVKSVYIQKQEHVNNEIPSKWKRLVVRCRRRAFWVVVCSSWPGTVSSADAGSRLWCKSLSDLRHVGHEVSCSSQDRKQALWYSNKNTMIWRLLLQLNETKKNKHSKSIRLTNKIETHENQQEWPLITDMYEV